jgi:methionyl-tRNA formyltransferase
VRVVFMGTPGFAVPSLLAVAEAHDVVCVFTRPDRPAGRGREARPGAVKVAALEAGIPIEQPESLDTAAEATLRSLRADIAVVVAYGLILRTGALSAPRLGCVNVHASLLPRWRGAAPIERAVLAGDEMTGVSIMRMEEGLDTGPWAKEVRVPVDGRYAPELAKDLATVGAQALIEVLGAMEAGTVTWTAQDDGASTYAAKITAADVMLDPILDAVTLERRVRASGTRAPARAVIGDRDVVVLAAEMADVPIPAGEVLSEGGRLLLGTAQGALSIVRVVPAGKRPMTGAEFARGARFDARAVWTAPE